MTLKQKTISAYFEIWKKKNFDLNYYFEKIFDLSLQLLSEKTDRLIRESIESGKYKCLFMPVGYKIENIALVAAFIKPKYLTLGFSDITRKFHNVHFDIVKKAIEKYCPEMNIEYKNFRGSSDSDIRQGISDWVKFSQYPHKELAIDLTGGTKPMAIGAQAAALYYKDIDAFYLYVDYDDKTAIPIPGTEQLIKLIKAGFQVDTSLVFVLMPNRDGFHTIYTWIQETVHASGLNCSRVEHETFTGEIMDKIRENIYKAGIIIADMTLMNPNVFYEIGIAHEAGKQVILLTQDSKNSPFDLKMYKHIPYKPDNKDKFVNELKKTINVLRDNPYSL